MPYDDYGKAVLLIHEHRNTTTRTSFLRALCDRRGAWPRPVLRHRKECTELSRRKVVYAGWWWWCCGCGCRLSLTPFPLFPFSP
jgi:hypothetical protein